MGKGRISKAVERIRKNILCVTVGIVMVFIISGIVLNLYKTQKKGWFCVGLAVIGLIIGLVTVIISLTEAKKLQNSFIIVMDLLLIIVVYAFIYTCIYVDDPLAFKMPHNGNSYLDFLYYSVVTFTTLGYGDIIPNSYLAKFTSASEAFIFSCVISIAVINFSKSVNHYSNNKEN